MSENESSLAKLALPELQSRWQHHSGTIYEVLYITNLKASKPDYPVTVVYRDPEGVVWSHPLEFRHSRMTLIV
jgi:hypothetical protein